MVAEYPPGGAGLPRSYVSCKLWVLAGQKSDEEIMLEMQRRLGLNESNKERRDIHTHQAQEALRNAT